MLCSLVLCFSVISSAKTCIAGAQGLIYIHSDGSIDPPTAPISTVDNVTYTLSGDISNDSIVIEKDNIVVDGTGCMIEGTGSFGYATNDYAITLVGSTNVTIKNMTIKAFGHGIELSYSSNSTLTGNNITTSKDGPGYGIALSSSSSNTIYGNNITNNKGGGITLYDSSYNSISRNNITNNWLGIALEPSSDNNTISGNDITNNSKGISLDSSNNNMVYHNNFMNNYSQVTLIGATDFWDNGFEGNYWSDYNGTDNNQAGIGDTPYVIDANNTDHFPLLGTFQSFNVSAWNVGPTAFEEVDVTSNSTIVQVQLVWDWLVDQQYPWRLHFTTQGENGTTVFFRITFPNDLLNASYYPVYVDQTHGVYIYPTSRILQSNGTHTTLYFSFNQTLSSYNIDIVPEFPLLLIPLFMITTLLAVFVHSKKHSELVRV